MRYEPALSVIYYICGCFYMLFGTAKISENAKSSTSRLFLLLTSSLATWSFSYSFSNSAPTAEASAFWRSFSAFGWGFFSSFLLHFVMVITKAENRFNKWIMYIVLYLPAFINIILFGPFGFFTEKHYIMVQSDYGWMNAAPMRGAAILLNSYYVIYSLATLIFLLSWWKKFKPHDPMKRAANQLLGTIIVLFFVEFAIEFLPEIFGKQFFPKVPVVVMLIPTIMLFRILGKFGLLIEGRKRTYSFLEIKNDQTGDRERLFRFVTFMFMLGGAMFLLIGYFGMKRSLESELLHAGVALSMGLFIRFVPLITENHTVQNSIFFAISALGMFHFMIRDIEAGGLTVWAVYILFLLFTVILDDKFNAIIFTVFSVAIQMIFWIFYPEISVTINSNEYLTRSFIIVGSYFAVRYLTTEYASRVKEYKKFADEQETLEQISSNLILIDSENAEEKIYEMLGLLFETLNFDRAYVIEFGEDYKNATFVNTYIKDFENDSFPYSPGMRLDKADLSVLKSMIDQGTPIMCEDIANLSSDASGEQRDFFASKGTSAFFAIPIMAEKKTGGMLVVEYNDCIDRSLAEKRLYFLKIIANVLGDARKKILYEKRLYEFAYFDESTKLANRNMLKKRLGEIIHNRKESEKVAILDIELENIRVINDSFGHIAGEQMMAKSAAILETVLQENCYISRPSEGSFVVVLPDVESDEQIEGCAKRLLDSFAHPVSTETEMEALFVMIRIGISMYPDDGRDAETLLKNANLAGYEARNASNKIVFYTEKMGSHIAENALFTNKLFESLQNEEFFLEFQPQISCKTGKTIGIEALLRWMSDGERIPPDRFIPILEQTGLIYEVGLWALKQALQEHKRLIAKGFPALRVSINVSMIQFIEKDLVFDFTKIIEESQVDPKYIELEITETRLPEDSSDVIQKLFKLKKLGVSISIDDFGKGYSSLYRLKMIPFDRIKIDKDVIEYIDLESKIAPITEIAILLGKAYNASITAEGVETKEQAEFLRSIGCDEMQGHYFSKSMSAEKLEEFLEKEKPGDWFENYVIKHVKFDLCEIHFSDAASQGEAPLISGYAFEHSITEQIFSALRAIAVRSGVAITTVFLALYNKSEFDAEELPEIAKKINVFLKNEIRKNDFVFEFSGQLKWFVILTLGGEKEASVFLRRLYTSAKNKDIPDLEDYKLSFSAAVVEIANNEGTFEELVEGGMKVLEESLSKGPEQIEYMSIF